jgi:multiple sugar transport system ATP-binding protein
MTMADVIVILRDGTIEQIGGPMDVYNRPANLFVAEFIGSPGINLVRGEVAAENGGPVLRAEGIALPLPPAAKLAAGHKVVYGIRPEHLVPSPSGSGIAAKVIVVEPTGPEMHIYTEIAGTEVCAVSRDHLDYRPDQDIRLSPMLDQVHLFDQDSGKAIGRSA